ncbi:MAG: hypothetical protein IPN20_08095 [Haliscomenobacter sp.]|nr:hypothetical protein [Haliscomenobacter sp.]
MRTIIPCAYAPWAPPLLRRVRRCSGVFLLLFLVLSPLSSCKIRSWKTSASEPAAAPYATESVAIVVTVLLKVKPGAPIVFSLENVIRAPGDLKENTAPESQPPTGYWVSILDKTGRLIASASAGENPLRKKMEYVNDEGKLASREVQLEEDWIALRFQEGAGPYLCRVDHYAGETAVRIVEFPISEK